MSTAAINAIPNNNYSQIVLFYTVRLKNLILGMYHPLPNIVIRCTS